MRLTQIRSEYHRKVCKEIIRLRTDVKKGTKYPNFADSNNVSSVNIALGIVKRLNCITSSTAISEQTAGGLFEKATCEFLEKSFSLLQHLRPGKWHYSTAQTAISGFSQYEHLSYLETVIKQDKTLSSALGGDYIVKPDIVISRKPVSRNEVNRTRAVIDPKDMIARLSPFLQNNAGKQAPILHASISCKWTIRSDRSQNTRTEALNLIRNRKGHLPHIAAVTAEPLPTRIATLALGTGDIDCVYHFALPELEDAIKEVNNQDQLDILSSMVVGKRLRDISDLPFDLAV